MFVSKILDLRLRSVSVQRPVEVVNCNCWRTIKTMHCTCGPHPKIDLTAAYVDYCRDDGIADDNAAQQIKDACHSHGCLQVTIDLAAASTSGSCPLACLGKANGLIEQDIESLFIPNFLKGAAETTEAKHDINWENMCNGGLLEIPFPTKSLPTNKRETHANTDSIRTATATFRGRIAESGDEQQPTPEPKLSWEFRRCTPNMHAAVNHTGVKPNGSDDDKVDVLNDDSWRYLPKWTNALHEIASLIINLLGIPPQLVLQENQCQCLNKEDAADSHKKKCCNIDLLRVFRYDALSKQQHTMGSSAHSDWGTLTVVWQDDKGGLQTYCHKCDKWSDVDASAPISPSHSEKKCTAFVHVGDFLSLATMSTGNNIPVWPSPRHRVLCPMIQNDDNSEASLAGECRRSLVYFAYPPPGISLDDARQAVAKIASSCPSADLGLADNDTDVYGCYSLLHNQSHQTPSNEKGLVDDTKRSSAFQMHQSIKNISFDKVISEKWNQVQRK